MCLGLAKRRPVTGLGSHQAWPGQCCTSHAVTLLLGGGERERTVRWRSLLAAGSGLNVNTWKKHMSRVTLKDLNHISDGP